jgi:mRNA interferase RelE/StbE
METLNYRAAPPAIWIRAGEVLVSDDISGATVEVLAIVANSEAQSWLAQFADPE